MSRPIIEVRNLSKKYQLGTIGATSLREEASKLFSKEKRDSGEFWALKDVSFEVEAGEVLGIIGRNGAGKSTLLKILSRITEPTSGEAVLRGRVASLLEVGTGFHPELSGRENVYLNGAILGMKHREISAKFDEIVAFAEIEQFIDTPVKRYSSGMTVRLAFAVAAHLEPEILIVDEVLAVGDAAFQRKCLGKIHSVAADEGRTVLFVSHSVAAIQKLCSHGLLLTRGRLARTGPIRDVIADYLESGNEDFGECVWADGNSAPGDGAVLRVNAMRVHDETGNRTGVFKVESPFTIEIEYEVLAPVNRLWVGFIVHTLDGEAVFCAGDQNFSLEPVRSRAPGRYRSICSVPANLLNENRYTLSLLSHIPGIRETAHADHVLRFDTAQRDAIAGGGLQPGFIRPILDWSVQPLDHFST